MPGALLWVLGDDGKANANGHDRLADAIGEM
jgi:hypothetical protein